MHSEVISVDMIFEDSAVDTTSVVLSDCFYIGGSNTQSVWVKATSASGTPSILVEYLVSWRADQDFILPETSNNLSTADELAHSDYITIPANRYLKIRLTGQGANPSDTVITVVMQKTRA